MNAYEIKHRLKTGLPVEKWSLAKIIEEQECRIAELEKELQALKIWTGTIQPIKTNAEPVAWMNKDYYIEEEDCLSKEPHGDWNIPLYTTPQTKQIWCDCGDSIEPDSGAICGNCLAAMKIGKE